MLLLGTLGLVAFGAICWVVLLASVAAVHAQYDELTGVVRSPLTRLLEHLACPMLSVLDAGIPTLMSCRCLE